MYISDFLKGGTTLTAPAGNEAINANDFLCMSPFNQLFPAKVTDFATGQAAALPIASTTIGVAPVANMTTRKDCCHNPVDGSAYMIKPNTATTTGASVYQYNTGGTLLNTLSLDTTSTLVCHMSVQRLSNGNYVATWGCSTTGLMRFAIFDQYCNIVTAATTVYTTDQASTFDCIALSGGGFAVSHIGNAASGKVFLAIYTNTGAVTLADAAITGTPNQATQGSRLCQLSNGNIVVAIYGGTGTSIALAYATFTAAGVAGVAYTVIDAATATGSNFYPEVASDGNGHFCIACTDQTNAVAYVYSNAGVLQGGGYSVATTNAVKNLFKLMWDGINSNFWFAYYSSVNSAISLAAIPVAGTGFVTTNTTLNPTGTTSGNIDGFSERGLICLVVNATTPTVYTWQINVGSPTSVSLFTTTTPSIGATSLDRTVHPMTDFTFLSTTLATFSAYKYLASATIGVAQKTLAAGNQGQPVSCGVGVGVYPVNTLAGTASKAFSGSGGNLSGSAGHLGNSFASITTQL